MTQITQYKSSDINLGNASLAFLTTTPLGGGGSYTSSVIPFAANSQVQTEVLADQDGTLTFQFYADVAGTDLIRTLTIPYTAANGYQQFGAPTFGLSVKYTFTNGATPQGDFFFCTKLVNGAVSPQVLPIDGFVTPKMMSTVNRSILTGEGEGGVFYNAVVNQEGHLEVAVHDPMAAFGEMLVAEKTPEVQLVWNNGIISSQVVQETKNGATLSVTNSRLDITTGTTTGARSAIWSARRVNYRPGQGSEGMFTTKFSAPAANTEMFVGYFDQEDGFAIGYQGTTFGFLHRSFGQREILEMVVTSAPTGNGNVTVTLNGSPVVVAVLSTDDINEAARKIALADYSACDGGYTAYYAGNKIIWIAHIADVRGGSNTFVDTDTTGMAAAGGITTLATGAAPTDSFIPQTSWNRDKFDNSGQLPTLDPTKGNVWMVNYMYLGYGGAFLFAKDPANEIRWVLCHILAYANANDNPILGNPSLPLGLYADNKATTSSITASNGSLMGSTQGRGLAIANAKRFVAANNKTISSSTETVILAVRIKVAKDGKTVKIRALAQALSLTNDMNQLCTFRLYANPGLQGTASWSSLNEFMEIDTASTLLRAGDTGQLLGSWGVAKDDSSNPNIAEQELEGTTGDLFVFTAYSNGASNPVSVSVSGIIDL